MLASIHPLGERARRSRWGVTVTAYLLGSVAGGAGAGAALGAMGAGLLALLPAPGAVRAWAGPVLAMARVQRPDQLRRLHRGFQRWAGAAARITAAAMAVVAAVAIGAASAGTAWPG